MREIIHNFLRYHKICAKRVPKMLTLGHSTKQLDASLGFLTHYHKEGIGF